jgi:hypothetical protein
MIKHTLFKGSPAIDLLVPSDTSDFEETGEPESEWLSEAIYVPFDLKYLPKVNCY